MSWTQLFKKSLLIFHGLATGVKNFEILYWNPQEWCIISTWFVLNEIWRLESCSIRNMKVIESCISSIISPLRKQKFPGLEEFFYKLSLQNFLILSYLTIGVHSSNLQFSIQHAWFSLKWSACHVIEIWISKFKLWCLLAAQP